MSAPRKIWVPMPVTDEGPCYVDKDEAEMQWGCTAVAYHHDDVVRELLTALAQAAVPLEGLTLAAHATGSNMGLCKGTWDEINNGVAHIRAALAKIAQEG